MECQTKPHKADSPKMMDIREFRELGFLQEVNRLFFHQCGLALQIDIDGETGEERLAGVWDYREDLEGIVFTDLSDEVSRKKAEKVQVERDKHVDARIAMFGSSTQPIGDKR